MMCERSHSYCLATELVELGCDTHVLDAPTAKSVHPEKCGPEKGSGHTCCMAIDRINLASPPGTVLASVALTNESSREVLRCALFGPGAPVDKLPFIAGGIGTQQFFLRD